MKAKYVALWVTAKKEAFTVACPCRRQIVYLTTKLSCQNAALWDAWNGEIQPQRRVLSSEWRTRDALIPATLNGDLVNHQLESLHFELRVMFILNRHGCVNDAPIELGDGLVILRKQHDARRSLRHSKTLYRWWA
jgi:hypothetical protein